MTQRYVGVRPVEFGALAERHRLTPAEQALLFRLLLAADFRTAEARGTLTYFAELLCVSPRHLGKHFDRLAECGLIDHRFPRGHEGVVAVLCYELVVHLPGPQPTKGPLRNGHLETLRTGHARNGSAPATDKTSVTNRQSVRSDQGSLSVVYGTATG